MNKSKLNIAYEQLKEYMLLCAGKAKLKLSNGFTTLNPSDGLYYGLWPDDFLFPIIVCPELLNKEELVSVMDFLTASTVGLEVVPDRIESDGMPMMSPGWYDSPLSYKMPAHMPAPWVRLLDYFEGWGVEIPQKSAWAKLIKRSFDNISFACGLVYMDPQKPYVGFAYHDNIAITGFDLMSSIVLHKAFERAAKLFNGYIEEEVINEWKAKSVAIQDNLWRLYDKDKGGFVAGSKDCRQINVWANGLIYGLLDDEEKKSSIFEFYKKNSDKIFKSGFTRQIAEDTGWERLLTDLEVGQYMNGGFWPTGTGYVLPAIYKNDEEFAIKIIEELLENLPRYNFTEWIDEDGNESHAKSFLMAIAIPLLAIKGLIEDKDMIEYF